MWKKRFMRKLNPKFEIHLKTQQIIHLKTQKIWEERENLYQTQKLKFLFFCLPFFCFLSSSFTKNWTKHIVNFRNCNFFFIWRFFRLFRVFKLVNLLIYIIVSIVRVIGSFGKFISSSKNIWLNISFSFSVV